MLQNVQIKLIFLSIMFGLILSSSVSASPGLCKFKSGADKIPRNTYHHALTLKHMLYFVRGDLNSDHLNRGNHFYNQDALDRSNVLKTDRAISNVKFSLDKSNFGILINSFFGPNSLLTPEIRRDSHDWIVKLLTEKVENGKGFSGQFRQIKHSQKPLSSNSDIYVENPDSAPFGFIDTIEFSTNTGILKIDTNSCVNRNIIYSDLTSSFRANDSGLLTVGFVQTCVLSKDITKGKPYFLKTTGTLEVCLAEQLQEANLINPTNVTVDSMCVDDDGDGWGWDGTKSFRMPGSGSTSSSGSAPCIDSDGDGWGWDGEKSCRP